MISVKIQNLGLIRNQKWLFRNLDLSIPSGSLVAIVGPSGVGKSSFLSCLSGLEESTEGKIEYKIDSNSLHTPENHKTKPWNYFSKFEANRTCYGS